MPDRRDDLDFYKEQLFGVRRSPKWRQLRNAFLVGKECLVCGGTDDLVAHHVVPFHIAPQLELAVSNLVPLCESGRYGINCHQLIGHFGNWRRFNLNVFADAAYWNYNLHVDMVECLIREITSEEEQ